MIIPSKTFVGKSHESLKYVASGHATRDAGMSLLSHVATISEFLLIVSSIYVGSYASDKTFILRLFGVSADNIYHACLMLFIVLPEVLAVEAICKSIGTVAVARRTGETSDKVWAGLTILFTVLFCVISAITIYSLLSPELRPYAQDISSQLLPFRALSALGYGILMGVIARIRDKTLEIKYVQACNDNDRLEKELAECRHQLAISNRHLDKAKAALAKIENDKRSDVEIVEELWAKMEVTGKHPSTKRIADALVGTVGRRRVYDIVNELLAQNQPKTIDIDASKPNQ